MEVTLNGARCEVPGHVTIRELIEHLGLTEGPVAVEINRTVIPRARHTEYRVSPGDEIEVVHFVGGG